MGLSELVLCFLPRLELPVCKLLLLQVSSNMNSSHRLILKLFQELAQQLWQWEAELLLVQAVLLLSALRERANAAFLLLDGGEGWSAQDRVDRTENTFCATQTGEYCIKCCL